MSNPLIVFLYISDGINCITKHHSEMMIYNISQQGYHNVVYLNENGKLSMINANSDTKSVMAMGNPETTDVKFKSIWSKDDIYNFHSDIIDCFNRKSNSHYDGLIYLLSSDFESNANDTQTDAKWFYSSYGEKISCTTIFESINFPYLANKPKMFIMDNGNKIFNHDCNVPSSKSVRHRCSKQDSIPFTLNAAVPQELQTFLINNTRFNRSTNNTTDSNDWYRIVSTNKAMLLNLITKLGKQKKVHFTNMIEDGIEVSPISFVLKFEVDEAKSSTDIADQVCVFCSA